MGITIKELSEISGYSITTISRVITNKGNVKKETKEAVKKLLVQYNYRTNVMDFLKSEQSSKIIMVILGVLDNFYYSSLIKVIKEKTETYGYSVLIGYTDNSLEEEDSAMDRLLPLSILIGRFTIYHSLALSAQN